MAGLKGEVGTDHILFRHDGAFHEERGPRNQIASRASEHGAQSLDGAPVYLAVLFELREVVDEGSVNHCIRVGCSTAQALDVLKIASMRLVPAAATASAPASERVRPST